MVTLATGMPARIMGLLGSKAIVGVGPPLSCNGPSSGSAVSGAGPRMVMVPEVEVTRLGSLSVTVAVSPAFLLVSALLTRRAPLVELNKMLSVIVAVADCAEPAGMPPLATMVLP